MSTNDELYSLLDRLEKTASIGSAAVKYLKDISGANIRRAEKAKKNVSYNDPKWGRGNFVKDVHNAKVDRNRALAGTAGVATLGGAVVGGHKANQEAKNKLQQPNQEFNPQPYVNPYQQQFKVAKDTLMERLEKTASTKTNNEEMVDVTQELMDRLEKVANEAYESRLADDRITEIIFDLSDKDPKYLESALQAEGLLDRAVEAGVFQDLTPGQGALTGGAVGGLVGGITGGSYGTAIGAVKNGLKGALAGGALGTGIGALGMGALGAGAGAVDGLYHKFRPSDMHLKYHGGEEEENPRQGAGSVSNAPAGVDKSASELLDRLEKTASEGQSEAETRILELMFANRNNPESLENALQSEGLLDQAVEGGVFKDPTPGLGARVGGATAGVLGGIGGGIGGTMAGGMTGGLKGALAGGAAGTGIGALGMGALGSGVGAATGLYRKFRPSEMHQKYHGEQQSEPIQEEQLASEDSLLDRLEKTANLKAVGAKAKDYLSTVTGKKHKDATKAFNAQNTPEALKANAPKVGVSNFRNNLEKLEKNVDKTKVDQDAARKALKRDSKVAGGAALLGATVGAGVASGQKKEASEDTTKEATIEKTASEQHEEMMNGLYKEAAQAIMNDIIPEVKQHVDPLDRIKF